MPQHCVRDMPTAGHGGCTVVTFSSCHLRDCLLVNASTAWTEGNSPAQNAETQDDMVFDSPSVIFFPAVQGEG